MAKQPSKIEVLAKQAAKNKAKEAADAQARDSILSLSLEDHSDGETTDFLASSKDVANDISEFSSEEEANKDIFSDIGEARVKQGDIIKYTIFKYGSQLTSVYHPCSWEMIHKKYGDGQYKVVARSQSLNRIVKTQSQMLGQPPAEFSFGGFSSDANKEEVKEAPVQNTQNQSPGFMEIFTLFMNQQNQAKAESKDVNMAAQQSQNQMMMMFMEMMKSNQQQSVQSQLQTMQMVTQVTEKMADAQSRMFEKLNERIEKIAGEKSKAPDMESVIERMQKAQEQGFALYQKFDELATKKAELQFEMMGGNDEDEEEKPEKESLTDTLIKTIIPLMAAGQRQMPQQFQQQQRPVPQQPQQRGQLSRVERDSVSRTGDQRSPLPAPRQQNQTRAVQQPPDLSRPGVAKSERDASGAENTGTNAAHHAEVIAASRETTSQDSLVGEEKLAIEKTEGVVNEPLIKMNGALPEVDVTTVVNEGDSFEDNEEGQTIPEVCREILPTLLGELMLSGSSTEIAAGKVLEALSEYDISREEFLEDVSANDLIDFGKQFNLPEEAYSWLNELYANIQITTGTDVGQFVASDITDGIIEGVEGQP